MHMQYTYSIYLNDIKLLCWHLIKSLILEFINWEIYLIILLQFFHMIKLFDFISNNFGMDGLGFVCMQIIRKRSISLPTLSRDANQYINNQGMQINIHIIRNPIVVPEH